MSIGRRRLVLGGGSLATLLALRPVANATGSVHQITMAGDSRGARVWFDPIGLLVKPGQTVRWVNADKGNSHTATAYHPASFGRVRRIPDNAMHWNSDFLLPDESFEWAFTVPGVYDYYCIPHEHAGMVGRIVVYGPGSAAWPEADYAETDLPETAISSFPRVADIVKNGEIRQMPEDPGANE